jgi:transcription-repair coupling factor (superfamily II helicase)
MRFLYHALHGENGFFVVPVHSLIQKVPPLDLFSGGTTTVRAATAVDPDLLIQMLLRAGYESAAIVTRVGEFSRRGGIIDFFSPSLIHPVRLELFGDAVESLRLFDPETQRSIGKMDQALILPVRELFITEEGLARLSGRIQDEVLLEQFRSGGLPPGGEFLAPFLYTMESLDRYFPGNTLLALLEPDDILKGAGDAWERASSGRAEESGEGRGLPETAEQYLRKGGP